MNDVTPRKRGLKIQGFEKSQLVEIQTSLRRDEFLRYGRCALSKLSSCLGRRLTFRAHRGETSSLRWRPHVMVGADGKVSLERLFITLLMSNYLKTQR